MDLGELSEVIQNFSDERDWGQFHSKENLAKSITIEAGELLECFQWGDPKELLSVSHELADVLIYALLLARKLDVEVDSIILEKLEVNRMKYPISKARGSSEKYDRL
jgi:NTP pyrophosphatase (non-canonical NTP hydrolase)